MKRKGFTLVELLAIIVILAIISAITIPMIMGIIETSSKEAFKDSVLSAFDEVEYYILKNNLADVPLEGIEVNKLNLKNNNFQYGIIIKNEDGLLKAENVSDGVYCAVGTMNDLSVTKGECDESIPTGEIVVEGKKVTIALKDDQGVAGYEITKSESVQSYTEVVQAKEIVIEYEATEAGTYYVHIKDKYGKTNRISFIIENSAFTSNITYIINGSSTVREIVNGELVSDYVPTVETGSTFIGWTTDNTSVTAEEIYATGDMTVYGIVKKSTKVERSNGGGQPINASSSISIPSNAINIYGSATTSGNTYDDDGYSISVSMTYLGSKSAGVPGGTASYSVTVSGTIPNSYAGTNVYISWSGDNGGFGWSRGSAYITYDQIITG